MGSPSIGSPSNRLAYLRGHPPMGPSTVWFLLLLSLGLVSVCTLVDGVRARGIQAFEKVSNSSSRVVSTGSAGSPPGVLRMLRFAPSGENGHLGVRFQNEIA
jgi:hypothetical protein